MCRGGMWNDGQAGWCSWGSSLQKSVAWRSAGGPFPRTEGVAAQPPRAPFLLAIPPVWKQRHLLAMLGLTLDSVVPSFIRWSMHSLNSQPPWAPRAQCDALTRPRANTQRRAKGATAAPPLGGTSSRCRIHCTLTGS